MAEKCGAVKRVANRFEFPDGKKVYEKAVMSDPESYFTEELLEKIDETCKKEFMYGKS